VSDLHSAPEWNLDNVLRPETKEKYKGVVEKILDGLSTHTAHTHRTRRTRARDTTRPTTKKRELTPRRYVV
jgi:3-deoxy-D-arabino-heptulosonate 7-phosphate (DAHP) synthase class II